MTTRLFVYGTLKEGFPNFPANHGRRLPGVFTTVDRLPLFLAGERSTPCLLDAPGDGFRVRGEVFEVDAAALALMDELEGVGEADGYIRRTLEVVDGTGARSIAHVYLKPEHSLAPADIRDGPLEEYTRGHAGLYRRRAASAVSQASVR